jgi:hypothetical protein
MGIKRFKPTSNAKPQRRQEKQTKANTKPRRHKERQISSDYPKLYLLDVLRGLVASCWKFFCLNGSKIPKEL